MINVRNLGARGNGQADDTEAIQKALQQAAGKGETVYFPKGVYVVNPEQGLMINGQTKVKGEGCSSIIKADDSRFGWELLRMDGNDITMDKMSLDGSDRVNRIVAIGGGSKRVSVTNCFVANATHSTDPASNYYSGVVSGIIVYGDTDQTVISGTSISNIRAVHLTGGSPVARGIYVTKTWGSTENAARNVRITGCYIHHIEPADDGDGIYYEDQRANEPDAQQVNSVISSNHFDYCAKRAIKIFANGVTISGNQISNPYLNNNYYKGTNMGQLAPDMYAAISLYGSNLTAEDNTITGAGSFYAAIEAETQVPVLNIVIRNNTIKMGRLSNIKGTTAIRLGDINNFTVNSNSIINGERGIWAWRNAEQGEISYNSINTPNGTGIDVSTYLQGFEQRNIKLQSNLIRASKYEIRTAPTNKNVVIS